MRCIQNFICIPARKSTRTICTIICRSMWCPSIWYFWCKWLHRGCKLFIHRWDLWPSGAGDLSEEAIYSNMYFPLLIYVGWGGIRTKSGLLCGARISYTRFWNVGTRIEEQRWNTGNSCIIHWLVYRVHIRGAESIQQMKSMQIWFSGMAKSALEAINGCNLFGEKGASWSVVYVDIDAHNRNRSIFETMLPRESSSKVTISEHYQRNGE